MIGYCFDIIINIGVKMLPALPVVNASRDHMPQMRDHTCGDKHLALGVKIHAPGVTETMRYYFKLTLGRMIPPHASIDIYAILYFDVLRKRVFVFEQLAFPDGL